MLTIGICDDEVQVVDRIGEIVQSYLMGTIETEIYKYDSGEKILEEDKTFDIIFMDIEMGSMNGVEAARELRGKYLDTKIIFVTGYDEFFASAFQVHAFEYIKKPFTNDKVEEVLAECLKYLQMKSRKKRVTIETVNGFMEFNNTDIYYMEFKNRKIEIVTKDGRYKKKGSLKHTFETIHPYGYGMPHNAYIVNFYNINHIKGYEIFMKDETKIPLAQKKAVDFKDQFHEYLHETFYYV